MLALACFFMAYIGAYCFNGQIKAKKIPHKNLNMQLTNTVESLSGQTKLAHSKKKTSQEITPFSFTISFLFTNNLPSLTSYFQGHC